MNTESETLQERQWGLLYDRISEVLRAFGTEDCCGRADYLLVDDNYGWTCHTVEIHKLHMLRPVIVAKLRKLLDDFPGWEIVIAVDIPGTEGKWPPMGVTIRKHELIDGLRRDYLPAEFRGMAYEGSRPGTGYD